ncbi:MAG TPA: FkbM family methyltransferase [Polyangiales bacterium]|nr:FkbM family methyltransferase [Polyangiales bacterium]
MSTGEIQFTNQQLRRWGRRVFDTFFCSWDGSLMPFGKVSSWHIAPARLRADSVVVSAGVGTDISFEQELIEYTGCRVLLLDPSPTGIATMARPENQCSRIEFLPVGLAGTDGELVLNPPRVAAEGSFWAAPSATPSQDALRLPCRSLSSLARERGFSRIDLLKMDIEGSEYDVIDDLVRSGLELGQVCVEFHHFMSEISLLRTLRALGRLRSCGLRLAHKQGSDYTLVRVSH